jgi:hypothetical protein
MSTPHDPLVGTWTLNPSHSLFDPNHRPQAATLVIERDTDGAYVFKAEGIGEKGQKVAEKTQTLVADGQPRPEPDFPGLAITCTRPDANTLHSELRREDGSIAGEGTYSVSADGRSLTAITAGFDSQLRQFEQRTSWDKTSSVRKEA